MNDEICLPRWKGWVLANQTVSDGMPYFAIGSVSANVPSGGFDVVSIAISREGRVAWGYRGEGPGLVWVEV